MFVERKINRGKFEGLVFLYLLNNEAKINTRRWKNDEYEDFISWSYPRLNKAIDTYKETGASFEAYITNIIRTASKEYRMRETINVVTEQSAWNAQIPEYYAREETPVYIHEKPDTEISQIILQLKGRKNPKQLLALVLKCYFYVSDRLLNKIAAHTGLDKKILKEMINKLRVMREKREDTIYRMKERIYGQFYRCIVYEHRLTHITENTTMYYKLKQRLKKARNRLEKMRKRVVKLRTCPSNREIAGVIGVTKGSVDAALYNLRVKLKTLAEKAILN